MTREEYGIWSAFERGEINHAQFQSAVSFVKLQRLKELRDIAVQNYEKERQRLLGNAPDRPDPSGD